MPGTIRKMSPQFVVTSLENSILFYTEKLGFEVEFRFEDFYAGILKDGCSIHLKQGHPSVEERMRKRENNDLDVVFSVHDVEDLFRDFERSGAEIVLPLCDQPYGREFYIADPDGYILCYLEEA